MAEQRFTRERSGPPGPRGAHWTWLLVIPLIGTLIPSIYNTRDPELFGVPFFYWYQMLWIPLSVLITLTVYRATRRRS
jgi:hypothetical protein